ncbi:hypothetical protein Tco_0013301 [Tanacetum coccineum]
MAADNGFVNLEQLRLLANSDLLKDQLLVYFDLKTKREVQLATEINNLTRQLLDIIDERRKKELKGIEKHDMIRRWEDEVVQLYSCTIKP